MSDVAKFTSFHVGTRDGSVLCSCGVAHVIGEDGFGTAPATTAIGNEEVAWVIVRDDAGALMYFTGLGDGNWHTAWAGDSLKAERYPTRYDALAKQDEGNTRGRGAFFGTRIEQHMWCATPAATPASERTPRDSRQSAAAEWVRTTFGDSAMRTSERLARFYEEATELAQSLGADAAFLSRIIDVVYSRPPGVASQEAGGVGLTLLALAEAEGFSAEVSEARELERVLSKSRDHFRARQATKADLGISEPVVASRSTEEPDGAPKPSAWRLIDVAGYSHRIQDDGEDIAIKERDALNAASKRPTDFRIEQLYSETAVATLQARNAELETRLGRQGENFLVLMEYAAGLRERPAFMPARDSDVPRAVAGCRAARTPTPSGGETV
ncbi:MAG: hypothetical protein JWM41_2868 [Gemmatimonadetes bacterium]|nr:hypothetical protein [Gemmatimonadota bacterium]